MQARKGSQTKLRSRLWYSHDPTRGLTLALSAKRLLDRLLGGTLARRALLARPSGYYSGGTETLFSFMSESAAILINPDYGIAYSKRAITGLVLAPVEFYGEVVGDGFSQSGEPMRYQLDHCLVDAAMGLSLSDRQAKPHAEYVLGSVLVEHSHSPKMIEQGRARIEAALADSGSDAALRDRCLWKLSSLP